jgi:predicted dienelactone hydrolase
MRLLLGLLLLLIKASTAAQPITTPRIGQRTLTFTDSSRQRPLVTEIWYPTQDTLKKSDQAFSPFIRQFTVRNGRLPTKPLPLIICSHGTGGGRLTMEWLAQGLAQKGFMVVAVDHWGNTHDHKIPLEFLKPWERPLDIRYVLTALLAHQTIKPAIDSTRMGALGFSFGGYTVLALAGAKLDYNSLLNYYRTIGRHKLDVPELPGVSKYLDDPALTEGVKRIPALQDNRLKAFFSISPSLGAGLSRKEQGSAIKAPVFIVGSQSDSLAPVKANARHYHQLLAKSAYYEFGGKTGHYVMLNEAIAEVKKSEPTYFLDDPSVNRHQIHAKVIELATQFFTAYLK